MLFLKRCTLLPVFCWMMLGQSLVFPLYPGHSQSVLLTPMSSHPVANGLSHLPVRMSLQCTNADKQGVLGRIHHLMCLNRLWCICSFSSLHISRWQLRISHRPTTGLCEMDMWHVLIQPSAQQWRDLNETWDCCYFSAMANYNNIARFINKIFGV